MADTADNKTSAINALTAAMTACSEQFESLHGEGSEACSGAKSTLATCNAILSAEIATITLLPDGASV